MNKLDPVELLTLDAGGLQQLLADGRLTSVELLLQTLAQIERENKEGLGLRAIISVAPKDVALEQAAELDRERANGSIRGPFHGLPLLVKVSLPRRSNTTLISWHRMRLQLIPPWECLRLREVLH